MPHTFEKTHPEIRRVCEGLVTVLAGTRVRRVVCSARGIRSVDSTPFMCLWALTVAFCCVLLRKRSFTGGGWSLRFRRRGFCVISVVRGWGPRSRGTVSRRRSCLRGGRIFYRSRGVGECRHWTIAGRVNLTRARLSVTPRARILIRPDIRGRSYRNK